MNKSNFKIETTNKGTLYYVSLNCGDGTTELCSSYYKTEKAAKKHLAKCQFWAGETNKLTNKGV